MGTPQFLMYMTVFCVFWLGWNTWAPEEWQFDSRALGFTLLTLMLSLQASYAAPLLLLAQNRQDDRDKVSLQQDRQRAERNLSDTEYLTRELASLRIALREVATRDYVRAELRSLLEDMLEAQEELRTHDPSAGAHETPREKVKEKLKDAARQAARPPDPADPPRQTRRQAGRPAGGVDRRTPRPIRRQIPPGGDAGPQPGSARTPHLPRKLSIARMSTPAGTGGARGPGHRDRPRTPPAHHRARHGGVGGDLRRRQRCGLWSC